MGSGDQLHYRAPPPLPLPLPPPPPPPPPPHHQPHHYQQLSFNPYHPHHIPNPYPNPNPSRNPNPNLYPSHFPRPIPGHHVIPPDPYAAHDYYNGLYASTHAYQGPPPAAVAAAGPSDPYYHGDAGHTEELAAIGRSSSDSMRMLATHKNPRQTTIAGEEDTEKPVEVGALYCEVCKIFCNRQDSLNTHKEGKQHKKNLHKLQKLITPSFNDFSCEDCAIVCCSQDDLDAHKNGKPHKRKLKKLQESISPTNALSCQVCDIVCSSKDDLSTHQQGRKHNKNLKKLEEPMMTNVQNGATSVVSQDKAVGKQPMKIAIPASNNYPENGKQKLLDCKIPEDEIRVRALCNVVSNNQVVVHDHMMGQKHAAMLKQQQSNFSVATKPSDAAEEAPVTRKDSNDNHPLKRAAPTTGEELETKKRNILDCGGNGDLVRECTICNAVCNGLSCEDCGIVCGSQDDLNAHKNERPHKEKMKELQESVSPINDLSCQVCDIVCSSKDDLSTHRQGRKHNKNLKKLQEPMMTNVQNGATSVVSQDKAVGKQPTKIAIPASYNYIDNKKENLLVDCMIREDEIRVCTLCSVVCGSQVVFRDHITGRKHAAMLKQQQSNMSVTTKPSDAVENAPVTSKDSKHHHKRAASTTGDELETKKRNILDCRGNKDLVRECTICNVVCNSQIAFGEHMAGSEHAMVVHKKQQQQAHVSMDGAA